MKKLLSAFGIILTAVAGVSLYYALATGGGITLSSNVANLTDSATSSTITAGDASSYTNLNLSFDYDVTNLDTGNSLNYGWTTTGSTTINSLGTIPGEAATTTTASSKTIGLPPEAQVNNLELVFSISGSIHPGDNATVTNIILTGDLIPQTPTLTAPTDLNISNLASTSLTLNWTAGTGATQYEILQGNNSLGTTTAVTFNVTGLTASTTYTFEVVSTDGTNFATSSPLATTTLADTISGGSGGGPSIPTPTIIQAPTPTTVIVTPSDLHNWAPDDVRGAGLAEINDNQPDNGGNGSLNLFTASSSNKAGFKLVNDFGSTTALTNLSFDFYRDSTSTVAGYFTPAFGVYVADANGNSWLLKWEGAYNNYLTTGPAVPTDTWITENILNGNFWRMPQTVNGVWVGYAGCNQSGDPYGCFNYTRKLSDGWLDGFKIVAVDVSIGSGWTGLYNSYVDKVKVNNITYDFEPTSAGPDIYVGWSGASDSNDCYSQATSCATIAHAIDIAQSGDTIHVNKGTYTPTGALNITKSLNIRGFQADIDARTRSTSSEAVINGQFKISADNVTINGFTINAGTGSAVTMPNADQQSSGVNNFTFENNITTGDNGINAFYVNAKNMVIKNNLLNNIGTAFAFTCKYGDNCTNTLDFESNTSLTNGLFVQIAGLASTTITDNTSNTSGIGIYSQGNVKNAIIENNTLLNSSNAVYFGNFRYGGNNITYGSNDYSSIEVHNNKFGGSGNGVRIAQAGQYYAQDNISGEVLDATNNWWGSITGPTDASTTDGSIPASNPGGTGSAAVGAVKYDPWCINATCSTSGNNNNLSLSGYIYSDGNDVNGCTGMTNCQDHKGPYLANWVVNLYKEVSSSTWDKIGSATTDNSGEYKLGSYTEAGIYHVCPVIEDGWTQEKGEWSGSGYLVNTSNQSGDSQEGPYCTTLTYDDVHDQSSKSNLGVVDITAPKLLAVKIDNVHQIDATHAVTSIAMNQETGHEGMLHIQITTNEPTSVGTEVGLNAICNPGNTTHYNQCSTPWVHLYHLVSSSTNSWTYDGYMDITQFTSNASNGGTHYDLSKDVINNALVRVRLTDKFQNTDGVYYAVDANGNIKDDANNDNSGAPDNYKLTIDNLVPKILSVAISNVRPIAGTNFTAGALNASSTNPAIDKKLKVTITTNEELSAAGISFAIEDTIGHYTGAFSPSNPSYPLTLVGSSTGAYTYTGYYDLDNAQLHGVTVADLIPDLYVKDLADNHYYYLDAFDTNGNYDPNNSKYLLTVDNTIPHTDINVSTSSGKMIVSGTATDDLGLNRVYVQLVNRADSQRYGGTTINLITSPSSTSSPWSKTYDFGSLDLPVGTYAVNVAVVDSLGNTFNPGWTNNFEILNKDTVAPVVTWISPIASSSVQTRNGVTATGTYNDLGSGIDRIHLLLSKGNKYDYNAHNPSSAPGSSFTVPGLVKGSHTGTFTYTIPKSEFTALGIQDGDTFTITAVPFDVANNGSTVRDNLVLIADNSHPNLTIDTPAADGLDFVTGAAITISGTATDTISELKNNLSVSLGTYNATTSGWGSWVAGCNNLALIGDQYTCSLDLQDGHTHQNLVDGKYVIRTTVQDTANNWYGVNRIINVGNTNNSTSSASSTLEINNEGVINASTTQLTLTWTTTHGATSRVIYDTVSHPGIIVPNQNDTTYTDKYGYASSTVIDTATTTNHSVTITGLIPNTTYYFRVISHGSPITISQEISGVTLVEPGNSSNNNTPTFQVSFGGGAIPYTSATYNPNPTPVITGQVLGAAAYQFTQNLKLGSIGDEVKALQKFLNLKGFTLAADGAGSIGHETNYFGYRTRDAVIRYQEANPVILTNVGIMDGVGTGNFFFSTRDFVNNILLNDATTSEALTQD